MPLQVSLSRAQEGLSHATAVARWKADQQMRLLRSQNQVRELEGQIKTLKARLADATLTLYAQERLDEDELKEICAAIAQLHQQIDEQQRLQEAVKNEQPPEQTYSATYPPSLPTKQPAAVAGGQLICPKCGKPVPVRFCPEHGVEGVPAQQ
jgi:DNA repair exonuclease SbcCD ATPase subunit